jgi:hypothetical protein
MTALGICCFTKARTLGCLARSSVLTAFAGFALASANAQTAASTVPKTQLPVGQGAYNWLYQAGLTCGAGVSTSQAAIKPTVQCGGLLTMTPFFEFEVGAMGPQASQSQVSGYLSTNLWIPLRGLRDSPKTRAIPFLSGGYTRMFETGHALDYGAGYAYPLDHDQSIRFEARDYWTFSNPRQHNVIFRVVWLVGLPD